MVKEKQKKKSFKILAASDIHGNTAVMESLSVKAEKEGVDLVILAGDIHGTQATKGMIYPFKKRNQKVIFLPGNWDTSVETNLLKETYQLKNIDGCYIHYDGIDIIGIGSPDFQMDLNEKKTLEKLIKSFEKIQNRPSKKIIVSHLHPRGGIAEFSGIPGSRAVRKAIDYFKPDFFISGHIHEAEGLEQKIGKTKLFQVGKKGKIIEIENDN